MSVPHISVTGAVRGDRSVPCASLSEAVPCMKPRGGLTRGLERRAPASDRSHPYALRGAESFRPVQKLRARRFPVPFAMKRSRLRRHSADVVRPATEIVPWRHRPARGRREALPHRVVVPSHGDAWIRARCPHHASQLPLSRSWYLVRRVQAQDRTGQHTHSRRPARPRQRAAEPPRAGPPSRRAATFSQVSRRRRTLACKAIAWCSVILRSRVTARRRLSSARCTEIGRDVPQN